jgi:hypothetical protein
VKLAKAGTYCQSVKFLVKVKIRFNFPTRMNMRLLAVILPLMLLAGCSEDSWEGFVYPDKADLTAHQNVGAYGSLEDCRSAAIARLGGFGAQEKGDYECGLNCEHREGYGGIKVCDETRR